MKSDSNASHGGAHGDAPAAHIVQQQVDECLCDDDFLLVHIVVADGLCRDGLEGAGSDVQGHILGANAFLMEGFEHGGGEVQSGGGGGHGAVIFGVNGLIACFIVGSGGALDVGWEGNLAVMFQPFGKRHVGGVPRESHLEGGTLHIFAARGGDAHLPVADRHVDEERVFPALGVAHHTFPRHRARLGEGRGGVGGGGEGLEAENLDGRARGVVHQQSRVNDLGVVEDEQVIGGELFGQLAELAVCDGPVPVNEQFGLVALGGGEEGDALFGQLVVVVLDSYVSIFCHNGGKNTKISGERTETMSIIIGFEKLVVVYG